MFLLATYFRCATFLHLPQDIHFVKSICVSSHDKHNGIINLGVGNKDVYFSIPIDKSRDKEIVGVRAL